jgi:hypothetical protein
MNEKIKALEQQCWSHRVDGVLVDGHLHFDTQKFAELIVLKCAEIADTAEPFLASDLIKQHFGVKE